VVDIDGGSATVEESWRSRPCGLYRVSPWDVDFEYPLTTVKMSMDLHFSIAEARDFPEIFGPWVTSIFRVRNGETMFLARWASIANGGGISLARLFQPSDSIRIEVQAAQEEVNICFLVSALVRYYLRHSITIFRRLVLMSERSSCARGALGHTIPFVLSLSLVFGNCALTNH